jgi:hypothetical protein
MHVYINMDISTQPANVLTHGCCKYACHCKCADFYHALLLLLHPADMRTSLLTTTPKAGASAACGSV